MKKIKTKSIIRFAIVIYLLYYIYSIPKKDWTKGVIQEKYDENGQILRYMPGQSSYIKYILTWWSNTFKEKGITGIIDEYILAPIGINFDEQTNNNNNNTSNSRSHNTPLRSSSNIERQTGTGSRTDNRASNRS